MAEDYYIVARPETLKALTYDGKLPERLPSYIKEHDISMYTDEESALRGHTGPLHQAFLLLVTLPDPHEVDISKHDKTCDELCLKTKQFDPAWLTKIAVFSLAGKKLVDNLFQQQCPLPVEIEPHLFESKMSNKPLASDHKAVQKIHYLQPGDVLTSSMQVHVNTVNCVGIMGKGIALAFKRAYPAMFTDYQQKCANGLVKIGQPYLYKVSHARWVLNFPTKNHWRQPSLLSYIEQGLQYLITHAKNWGITSMAFPPLGCGNGGLSWATVFPIMLDYLARLPIPIEIHSPTDCPISGKNIMCSKTQPTTNPLKRKAEDSDFFKKHTKLD